MISQFLYLLHPLSFLLLFPFFFINVFSAEFTNSTCPSYKCGDVNISYPFWKIDHQNPTQICGYDGFGINCSNNISQITLGSEPYYVEWINYEHKIMRLADFDVSSAVPGPKSCPRLRHNISIQTLPLSFIPYSVNLSFHFNCTECPSFATALPCLDGNVGRKSCVHRMNNTSTEETEVWGQYSCSEVVITAVLDEPIDDLGRELSNVLEKGFELEWGNTDECDKCEDSDGRCGHLNQTEFRCFCSDSTIKKSVCRGYVRLLLDGSMDKLSFLGLHLR